jgi:hypothetical protein
MPHFFLEYARCVLSIAMIHRSLSTDRPFQGVIASQIGTIVHIEMNE